MRCTVLWNQEINSAGIHQFGQTNRGGCWKRQGVSSVEVCVCVWGGGVIATRITLEMMGLKQMYINSSPVGVGQNPLPASCHVTDGRFMRKINGN